MAAAAASRVLEQGTESNYVDDTVPLSVVFADVSILKKHAVCGVLSFCRHHRPVLVLISHSSPFFFSLLSFRCLQEYHMTVTRGLAGEETWAVSKRYSEFDELNTALQAQTGCELPLPPKKMFGNTDRAFVAERQRGLEVGWEVGV